MVCKNNIIATYFYINVLNAQNNKHLLMTKAIVILYKIKIIKLQSLS